MLEFLETFDYRILRGCVIINAGLHKLLNVVFREKNAIFELLDVSYDLNRETP